MSAFRPSIFVDAVVFANADQHINIDGETNKALMCRVSIYKFEIDMLNRMLAVNSGLVSWSIVGSRRGERRGRNWWRRRRGSGHVGSYISATSTGIIRGR